jgi:hypothetical protein
MRKDIYGDTIARCRDRMDGGFADRATPIMGLGSRAWS